VVLLLPLIILLRLEERGIVVRSGGALRFAVDEEEDESYKDSRFLSGGRGGGDNCWTTRDATAPAKAPKQDAENFNKRTLPLATVDETD